jgi:hypothetical protein
VNRQEQLDVATLVIRLIQIKKESGEPEHWLWERIRTCDFPRLGKYITDPEILKNYSQIVAEL